MVGGKYAKRNIESLAMDGRLAHLSGGDGTEFSVPVSAIMAKSKARALAGIDVITRNVETAPAQALRYRAAHEAQANHADMPHSPDSL